MPTILDGEGVPVRPEDDEKPMASITAQHTQTDGRHRGETPSSHLLGKHPRWP
jgi:hypothetical protein